MTNRVEKSKSKKSSERDLLVLSILQFGVDTMPCSFCSKRGLRCRIIEKSSRCGECVRRGRSYDGTGILVNALGRIIQESKRLEAEEDAAEELFAEKEE